MTLIQSYDIIYNILGYNHTEAMQAMKKKIFILPGPTCVHYLLASHVFILCPCVVVVVNFTHDLPIHVHLISLLPSPGLPPSLSPPASNPPRCQYSRSISEARFNALRLEYQEYRRAQESIVSCEPCLTPGPDSDSDTSSALL